MNGKLQEIVFMSLQLLSTSVTLKFASFGINMNISLMAYLVCVCNTPWVVFDAVGLFSHCNKL